MPLDRKTEQLFEGIADELITRVSNMEMLPDDLYLALNILIDKLQVYQESIEDEDIFGDDDDLEADLEEAAGDLERELGEKESWKPRGTDMEGRPPY
jgi:hypothetical protein